MPKFFAGSKSCRARAQATGNCGEFYTRRGAASCCATTKPNRRSRSSGICPPRTEGPAAQDVLASLPVDKVRAQKIVTLLLRDRVLVKVGDDLAFHRDALDGLRKLVISQKARTPRLNVVAFKDLIGVTRKYAIPLLEYLDHERVTRRVGDERVIL